MNTPMLVVALGFAFRVDTLGNNTFCGLDIFQNLNTISCSF